MNGNVPFSLPPQEIRGHPLTIMRMKEMRGQNVAKIVWMWWAPTLSDQRPVAISARQTARVLGVKVDRVRKVLVMLIDCGLMAVAKPATGGTPAEYVLGPRAMPRRRGIPRALQFMATPEKQQAA